MLHTIWGRGIFYKSHDIEMSKSSIHGQGVFAKITFKPGQLIEKVPIILIPDSEKELLQQSKLFDYYFLVNNKDTPLAIGLGYSSLYNHSSQANASYIISLKEGSLTIKACKKIRPGDEITLNYNGQPDDATPVYFKTAAGQ
jgi:uncharacterized protein